MWLNLAIKKSSPIRKVFSFPKQHFLYFFPLPHGQGLFLPIFIVIPHIITIQLPSRFEQILSISIFSCKDFNVLSIALFAAPIFLKVELI